MGYKSDYVAQRVDKVLCPACNEIENIYLLFRDNPNNSDAFYICFHCKYIGQIGVGRVEVIHEIDD